MDYFKANMLKMIFPVNENDEYMEWSYEMLYHKHGKVYIVDSKVMDEKRAMLLEIFVSRFILLHELGHIFNGHCKFVTDITNGEMDFIPMHYIGKKELNEKQALDIRTLEFDADAFAVTQSIMHIVSIYSDFEKQVDIKDMEPEDLFYWWGFAIRSHFLVCEDSYIKKGYSKKMTHLPSVARWTQVCVIATELIDEYNILEGKKKCFNQKIIDGSIEAERVFNDIKYTRYNWENQMISDEYYTEYKKEIDENWNNVKKILEKYARLPLWEESEM